MSVSVWFKRKMAMLALATSNVEKNALSGENKSMSDGIGHERRLNQDRLSDALQRGEVTQEVKELRWRMYKILDQVSGSKANIKGVDGDGNYIVEYTKNIHNLSKIKLDSYDDYPLEMVIYNETIPMGVAAIMGVDGMETKENEYIHKIVDDKGVETGELETRVTKGEITFEHLESQQKTQFAIMLDREFPTKINIENYTEKLNIRNINDDEKLLEFYIVKYPNEMDRKTNFLISEIKKCVMNSRSTNIIDISGVGFLTSSTTLGAHENLLFQYEIIKFNKIVEFGGHYVIKFNAKVLVNGERTFDKYRVEELDEKYINKVKKDTL